MGKCANTGDGSLSNREDFILELQAIIASLFNKKLDSENIVCIQIEKVKVISELMEWTVDGEYGGEYEKVTIVNKNRAGKVVVG